MVSHLVTLSLFAGHGSILEFLSFLDNGAESAAPMHKNVVYETALNSSLFSNLSTDDGAEIQTAHAECADSVEHAAFAHLFSGFADRQAWQKPCKDAEAEVVEATEKSVFPFTHF